MVILFILLSKSIEKINLENENNYIEDGKSIKTTNKPDDLLYIIYTSGSTGIPKGTMITHRNVVRLMKNNKFQFDFSEKDIWTMFMRGKDKLQVIKKMIN